MSFEISRWHQKYNLWHRIFWYISINLLHLSPQQKHPFISFISRNVVFLKTDWVVKWKVSAATWYWIPVSKHVHHFLIEIFYLFLKGRKFQRSKNQGTYLATECRVFETHQLSAWLNWTAGYSISLYRPVQNAIWHTIPSNTQELKLTFLK